MPTPLMTTQTNETALGAGVLTTEPVERITNAFRTFRNHQALINAARNGDIDAVRTLIPTCDPKDLDSPSLGAAAMKGHLQIVQMLISVTDPKASNSLALQRAANAGHLDIVRELIPVSEPRAGESKALKEAAAAGHLDVVRALIPVSDPKAAGSDALCWAARMGHLQIVRELIPVSDPHIRGCDPLRIAAKNKNDAVVRELVAVSDASLVFRAELAMARLEGEDNRKVSTRVSTAAVNALTPYVTDTDREYALSNLPLDAIEYMPDLIAWRLSRELRLALQPTLTATPSPRPRRSL